MHEITTSMPEIPRHFESALHVTSHTQPTKRSERSTRLPESPRPSQRGHTPTQISHSTRRVACATVPRFHVIRRARRSAGHRPQRRAPAHHASKQEHLALNVDPARDAHLASDHVCVCVCVCVISTYVAFPRVSAVSTHVCVEFARVCGEFTRVCGEFPRVCRKFARVCGEFARVCGEFTRVCVEYTCCALRM